MDKFNLDLSLVARPLAGGLLTEDLRTRPTPSPFASSCLAFPWLQDLGSSCLGVVGFLASDWAVFFVRLRGGDFEADGSESRLESFVRGPGDEACEEHLGLEGLKKA